MCDEGNPQPQACTFGDRLDYFLIGRRRTSGSLQKRSSVAHAHAGMAPLLFLLSFLLAGSHGDVVTVKNLVVLEGRSVTVPCHYEPQYARHVKYWCQGSMYTFCSRLARTDVAQPADARVSITDDPAQQVFTVTMSDLQEADSGWYWCGVEVGGMWKADDAMSVQITVSHGMSVVNSMVAGEEGGSVNVQCLYGSRHSGSSKKWCRSGDWGSCLEVSSNSTREAGPVLLSDDGAGAFTVTVRALEQGDAGWYWCVTGQEQVSVQVAVTSRSTTQRTLRTSLPLMTSLPVDPKEASTSLATTSVRTASQERNSPSHVFGSPLVIGGSLLLLVIVAVVTWKTWCHYQRIRKRRDMGGAELTFSPHPGSENDQNKGGVIFFQSSSPQQVLLL
ncbi:hypothetical protein ANANG_G00168640 [Anguilla anguilla]|uniref:Ig-like domain-containing protein n=1 Tax=Anguilla anguilla TaxID=7936 RepID=A0A9D3M4R4_ANGAN|nr:hypothetical protein ANANG_G00168640 [Anguilla anguilla]